MYATLDDLIALAVRTAYRNQYYDIWILTQPLWRRLSQVLIHPRR